MAEDDDALLTGDASKFRLFAASVDNILAMAAALLAASWLSGIAGEATVGVAVCVYLAYFLVQEATWSNTIGKRLFGLRLCRLDGVRCGWVGASIRTALRVAEVNPILLGGLPAVLAGGLSKRHQRVGDMLAGTVVTRAGTQSEVGGGRPTSA